jgi:hypothetical protein
LRAAPRQRAARTGFVSVRAQCDEQCAASASATVTVARVRSARGLPARLGPIRRTLAAGASVRFRLRLPAATRAAVRRALRRPGRRVLARITVVAADAAANRTRRRATVRLTG